MTRYAEKFEPVMRERLSEERYRHVLAVRDCAVTMAGRFGGPVEEAALAGLLHDYARELPDQELLRLAMKYGISCDRVDYLVPALLHGPVAAVLVKGDLGIDSPPVLEAIEAHTLGNKRMNRLDQIIYLSDLVAEGRDFPGVDDLRRVAASDLREGVLLGFAFSIRYCLDQGKLIHPRTIEAWNALILQSKEANCPDDQQGNCLGRGGRRRQEESK